MSKILKLLRLGFGGDAAAAAAEAAAVAAAAAAIWLIDSDSRAGSVVPLVVVPTTSTKVSASGSAADSQLDDAHDESGDGGVYAQLGWLAMCLA